MTCRRGGGAFLTGRIAGLLLAGTSASTAFITGVAPLGAAADNGHGRVDRAVRNVAQGKDPRPGTKLSVAGATRNRGYQHTSTNTAGGSSNVQNALCRRARVCNVTQHVTVVGPRVTESPAPPAPAKAPGARPTPVPTVTVTVTAAPPIAAPAEPPPCPAPRPLLRVVARVDAGVDAGIDARAGRAGRGTGLLEGLVSLSVLPVGTACPGATG
ncbi:hypothetical protein ACFYOK_24965 [Microbispora bryophytorum]|uniref:hypothetical protein n=1 Tax=Microbispora bryophytorum TaxID=1460882 RepID=UPI0033D86B11